MLFFQNLVLLLTFDIECKQYLLLLLIWKHKEKN